MCPNDQNSDRGIETSFITSQCIDISACPNDQNSDRGIETGARYELVAGERRSPNDQNSDRGIETRVVCATRALRGWSERPEFRPRN